MLRIKFSGEIVFLKHGPLVQFKHRGTGGGGGSSSVRAGSRSRARHSLVSLCTCIYNSQHAHGVWSLDRFAIASSTPAREAEAKAAAVASKSKSKDEDGGREGCLEP